MSQIVSTNKDIQKTVRRLMREGWTTEWTGKHAKLYTPDKTRWMTVSCTPSDKYANNAFERELRKLFREDK